MTPVAAGNTNPIYCNILPVCLSWVLVMNFTVQPNTSEVVDQYLSVMWHI